MKATLYQDKKREWRWRIQSANGRIVADSAEGYKRRRDCLKMLENILWMARGNFVEITGKYD